MQYSIDRNTALELCDSMPKRIEGVSKAKGGHTKYYLVMYEQSIKTKDTRYNPDKYIRCVQFLMSSFMYIRSKNNSRQSGCRRNGSRGNVK